jgi:hypothetical protein
MQSLEVQEALLSQIMAATQRALGAGLSNLESDVRDEVKGTRGMVEEALTRLVAPPSLASAGPMGGGGGGGGGGGDAAAAAVRVSRRSDWGGGASARASCGPNPSSS